MGVIPAAFAALSSNYPRRDIKNPALYQYVEQVMTGLQGSLCCVQMSHALNTVGIQIPAKVIGTPIRRRKSTGKFIIISLPLTN